MIIIIAKEKYVLKNENFEKFFFKKFWKDLEDTENNQNNNASLIGQFKFEIEKLEKYIPTEKEKDEESRILSKIEELENNEKSGVDGNTVY
jgi:hypothetical protein